MCNYLSEQWISLLLGCAPAVAFVDVSYLSLRRDSGHLIGIGGMNTALPTEGKEGVKA